ncbi:MAG: lysophospholipid acyltransferase family protein [Ginsengibacter sp.]
MVQNILARIFAVWALVIFVITLIPAAILIWMTGSYNEPKRTEVFRIISKVWMRIFFFATGCSLKVIGADNFKEGQNYIVTCNHNSFMDVPVTTPFIPGPNKTIAKAEMAKIPVFGLIYKRGSILVDRKDKNSRQNSFNKMKNVLKGGMHMCIYPEGTRNKTALPLKEFYDGAFKLAVETGVDIIPALLFGTKKILPPDRGFYFWPNKMELHFLPPCQVNGTDNFEIVKGKVFEIMKEYYVLNKAPRK